jgi:hypothetical protein
LHALQRQIVIRGSIAAGSGSASGIAGITGFAGTTQLARVC